MTLSGFQRLGFSDLSVLTVPPRTGISDGQVLSVHTIVVGIWIQ